jgi:hypothetical protein
MLLYYCIITGDRETTVTTATLQKRFFIDSAYKCLFCQNRMRIAGVCFQWFLVYDYYEDY